MGSILPSPCGSQRLNWVIPQAWCPRATGKVSVSTHQSLWGDSSLWILHHITPGSSCHGVGASQGLAKHLQGPGRPHPVCLVPQGDPVLSVSDSIASQLRGDSCKDPAGHSPKVGAGMFKNKREAGHRGHVTPVLWELRQEDST